MNILKQANRVRTSKNQYNKKHIKKLTSRENEKKIERKKISRYFSDYRKKKKKIKRKNCEFCVCVNTNTGNFVINQLFFLRSLSFLLFGWWIYIFPLVSINCFCFRFGESIEHNGGVKCAKGAKFRSLCFCALWIVANKKRNNKREFKSRELYEKRYKSYSYWFFSVLCN